MTYSVCVPGSFDESEDSASSITIIFTQEGWSEPLSIYQSVHMAVELSSAIFPLSVSPSPSLLLEKFIRGKELNRGIVCLSLNV